MTGILFALVLAMPAADESPIEARVMTLSQQLRCLVCQNETLADSRADLAADLRNQIREQMEAGRSDREILLFLTDRYGDFVLYRPRVKPATYALWFGPFLLVTGGLFALYRSIRVRSSGPAPLSAEEKRRAAQLLTENTKELA